MNTFFSIAGRMISRRDYMLGHKISLNTFKRIKITSSIFPNHNGLKRKKINNEKNFGKLTNIWK